MDILAARMVERSVCHPHICHITSLVRASLTLCVKSRQVILYLLI